MSGRPSTTGLFIRDYLRRNGEASIGEMHRALREALRGNGKHSPHTESFQAYVYILERARLVQRTGRLQARSGWRMPQIVRVNLWSLTDAGASLADVFWLNPIRYYREQRVAGLTRPPGQISPIFTSAMVTPMPTPPPAPAPPRPVPSRPPRKAPPVPAPAPKPAPRPKPARGPIIPRSEVQALRDVLRPRETVEEYAALLADVEGKLDAMKKRLGRSRRPPWLRATLELLPPLRACVARAHMAMAGGQRATELASCAATVALMASEIAGALG